MPSYSNNLCSCQYGNHTTLASQCQHTKVNCLKPPHCFSWPNSDRSGMYRAHNTEKNIIIQCDQAQCPMHLVIQNLCFQRAEIVQIRSVQCSELYNTSRHWRHIAGMIRRRRTMPKDQDMCGGLEGKGSVWVFLSKNLDRLGHGNVLRERFTDFE